MGAVCVGGGGYWGGVRLGAVCGGDIGVGLGGVLCVCVCVCVCVGRVGVG